MNLVAMGINWIQNSQDFKNDPYAVPLMISEGHQNALQPSFISNEEKPAVSQINANPLKMFKGEGAAREERASFTQNIRAKGVREAQREEIHNASSS